MTDKKKPTVQFGDYSKDFLEAFEKETERLIAEQKGEKKRPEPKKLDEQEQKELLESLKQLDEVERNQPKPISENKMNEYLTTLRDIDAKQRNIDSKRPVTEGDLLGGTDTAVTQAQLRQATGELYARIQTSLASVGGGGLGTIMQGVQGSPQDGQLPMYNDSEGKMVWATVFGVGEAYSDSDALIVILDTVDSAYVQARQTGAGLDSAQVINLITGTVDSDYVAARDSDLLSTAYTTADHDSDTLAQVDSAYVQARVDGGLDSAAIINLIIGTVDSDYVAARDSDTQSDYGDSDVIALLNGDSGVQNVIPQLDSTYDLGSPTNRFKDLYLSKNTIYMGQNVSLSADGTLGDTYLYVNGDPVFPGALDSAKVIALIDSAYVQARDSDKIGNFYQTVNHDSDTLVQVDSAYIAARLPDLYDTPNHDSDTLVQVDSAYVRARQIRTLAGLDDTQIDSATIATDDFLQWNGTDWIAAPFSVDPGLSFNGSIDATADSAPSASGGSLYVNTGSGVVLGSYNGIAGDSIDSGQAIAYAESDGQWYILGNINEGGVVEVRQGNGISIDDSNPARPIVAINRTEVDTWYVDSARVEAMIDSDYVNLHSDHYTTANHDSDTLVQVDSAYVQARVSFDSGLDSAQAVAIIDSYVDSAFIGQHWRALENRYVPIVGPSTQTQGLYIADSFQVNTGEIWFGDQNFVGIKEVMLDSFIEDNSMGLAGFGGTADLDEANGTYVVVGGGWNTDNRIAVSTDFASQTWTVTQGVSGAPTAGNFYGVGTDGSGTWVAVGYRSNIVYSTDDGATWQFRNNVSNGATAQAVAWSGTDYIFDVTHDGTQFIIGGQDGKLATSTDGANWQMLSTTGDNLSGNIKAVKYEPNTGRYVIGTTDGIWYTAPNGAVTGPYTQAINLGGSVAVFDAVYEPVRGIWSFFGDGGALWRMNNPNDFTSWSTDTILGGFNVRSASLNQYNHIVAVGFNGEAQVSTDAGVTWTTIETNTGQTLFGVVWDNEDKRWVFGAGNRLFYKVVVEGGDGLYFNQSRLLTELDSAWVRALDLAGVDSEAIVSIIDSYVDSEFVIRHADSHFVNAAGDSMTGKLFAPSVQIGPDPDNSNKSILFLDAGGDSVHELEVRDGSADLETNSDAWLISNSGLENRAYQDLAYGEVDGEAAWVVVHQDTSGEQFHKSTDGVNWQKVPQGSPRTGGRDMQGIAWNGSRWVVVGPNSFFYSDNLSTWTTVSQTGSWSSVASNGSNTWVVVGQSGVRTSTDNGATWTTPTGTDLQSKSYADVVYANGKFLAIAQSDANALVVTSTDGTTWTETATTLPSTNLWKTAYGNNTWVATETGNRGYYSTDDGATWTQISTGNGWAMRKGQAGVAFGGGLFATMTNERRAGQYSEDGINWYSAQTPSVDNFTQIRYGGGKFVVVGTRSGQLTMSFAWGEAVEGGLFIDDKQIVTEENLEPLIDAINGLAASRSLVVDDSDPTTPGDSDIVDGLLWYNTATNILSIRDSGGWTGVVNGEAVKAIIDSGYVQHRVSPGTILAGGRVVCVTASQNYDSSDVLPGRFVKSLWGINEISKISDGVYQFFFDSAVNTALVDSYSYIVNSTLDYKTDDPGGVGGSQRTLNVLNQDSNSFTLVLERGDGDNQDYGDVADGARMNFTVTKAI